MGRIVVGLVIFGLGYVDFNGYWFSSLCIVYFDDNGDIWILIDLVIRLVVGGFIIDL